MNHKRSFFTIILLSFALLLPCAMPQRAVHADNRHPVPPVEDGSDPVPVKISPDLLTNSSEMSVQTNPLTAEGRVRAIVQTRGLSDATLEQFINVRGGHVLRRFSSFKATSIEMPAAALDALAEMPEVRYISKDRQTRLLGHVSLTTGADAARAQA